MKLYRKAILPQGFKVSAVACGIKRSGKPDLALFYSAVPAKTAALFTVNTLPAAPVILCKKYLKREKYFQAIIANSGNANCFTGKNGLIAAEETAENLALNLALKKENILVASTGIIGRPLAVEKIKKAISQLVAGLSSEGIEKAQKAIMTTDTFPKAVSLKYRLKGKVISITGVAKGSGMIAPDLATMLCFLFTDAAITQEALKLSLKQAAEGSFNCITVDGCMSTNDMIAVLANGMAGNEIIDTDKHFHNFTQTLSAVCLELAKMLIQDAEGASKFIQIKVNGAKDYPQAKRAALFIANSNLFKTAIYGQNPNFGRIVASLGASGIKVKEEKLKFSVSSLRKKDVFVEVNLGLGQTSATVYTSDLTPAYIKINAEYN